MTDRAPTAWAAHNTAWRDPAQVIAGWPDAAVDPELLRCRTRGAWWETLDRLAITLLVSREYEHLLVGMTYTQRPHATCLPMPHPSGIAVHRKSNTVAVAATRNPNLVYRLRPAAMRLPRGESMSEPLGNALMPCTATFHPGCLYLHDLAYIGNKLYGTSAGTNALVELRDDGSHRAVWWPRCIDDPGGRRAELNYLQLNSIAAGTRPARSYYTASTDRPGTRRPGQRNFPVDGRGVVYDGRTREVYARGLTRPHSARLHDGRIWVDDSGYGRLVIAERNALTEVARFPGWTRGLCFVGDVAFVGLSRVIPRFRAYAPGLDVDNSECAIHAIDTRTGRTLGSIVWPNGNQIFAVDWLPRDVTDGFPFTARRAIARERALFYASTPHKETAP